MEVLKRNFNLFLNSEDEYISKNITYKKNYLFYGNSIITIKDTINKLAESFNRNIFYLKINNITNAQAFFELINTITYNKTIIVIENIDIFLDSIQYNEEKYILFLQIINGEFFCHGRIIIMTSKEEILDNYLINFDNKYLFNNIDKKNITSDCNDGFNVPGTYKLNK